MPSGSSYPRGYRIARAALWPIAARAYGLRTDGLDHLPTSGPVLVASNHQSFLDSVFLPLAVPRRLRFLGKAEYWESSKTRWLMSLMGHIPVERDSSSGLGAAMQVAMAILRSGVAVGVYPEGTRSIDGRLYRGKPGVAYMAALAQCPIVPVGLTGTEAVMPKGARLPKPRGKVVLRFGDPITVPQEAAKRSRVRREVMYDLMQHIAGLSGRDYVDEFAPELPSGGSRRTPAGHGKREAR